MAVIIEELLASVGLDTTKFDKARPRVKQGVKDTGDETDKLAKQVAASAKKQGEAFTKLRGDVTGFLLTLAGAKSLTQFGANLINTTAQVGRVSAVLGQNTNVVNAWGDAAKAAGGSAQDAFDVMGKMQSMAADFYRHPENVPLQLLGQLGFRGSPNQIAQRFASDPSEVLYGLGDEYQNEMSRAGKNGNPSREVTQALFIQRLNELGFGAMAQVIMQGRPAMQAQIKAFEEHDRVTKADAQAAMELNNTLTHLQTSLTGLARSTGVIQALDGVAGVLDVLDGTSQSLTDNAKTLTLGFISLLDPFQTLILWLERAGIISSASAATALSYDPAIAIEKRAGLFDRGGATPGSNLGNSIPNDGSTGGGGGGGGSGSPAGFMSTLGGRAFVASYLRSRGVDEEHVQGIMLGMASEGGGTGMASNGAFGLLQLRGSRRVDFQRFAAKRGKAMTDPATQLEFMLHEMHDKEYAAGRAVQSASGVANIGAAYSRYYMRPGKDLPAELGRQARMLARGSLGAGGGAGAPITVNVDASGHKDPKAVEQAAHRGVHKALHTTHRVANANTGVS